MLLMPTENGEALGEVREMQSRLYERGKQAIVEFEIAYCEPSKKC
jgi:hypothetical protein